MGEERIVGKSSPATHKKRSTLSLMGKLGKEVIFFDAFAR